MRVTYAGLAPELWDRHLWMYGELQASLARLWNDHGEIDHPRWVAPDAAHPQGVACLVAGERGRELCVAAHDAEVAVSLTREARGEIEPPEVVSTPSAEAAEAIRDHVRPGAPIRTTVRLWTRDTPPTAASAVAPRVATEHTVRELTAEDAPLFTRLRFEDGRVGWPGYRAGLESGLRWFGALRGGELSALAGVARVTRHRVELVGVLTFDPRHRRTGLATLVCRRALAAALETAPVATWTTDGSNDASVATARSLGFRVFETIHRMRLA